MCETSLPGPLVPPSRQKSCPTKTHNRQKFKAHPVSVPRSCPTHITSFRRPPLSITSSYLLLPAVGKNIESNQPKMRPILLSGHERALTQIRYVAHDTDA